MLQLGVFDGEHQQHLTEFGRRLAGLALHPRLAALLLTGRRLGAAGLAADLAALLEQRDLLPASRDSDLRLRLQTLQVCRNGRTRAVARELGADPERCVQTLQLAKRWRSGQSTDDDPSVTPGQLLAAAYPDRIAQRRASDPHRYRLANGRGARLDNADSLSGNDWLVAAHLDAGERESRIYLAAAIEPGAIESLFVERITTHRQVDWDAREQAVASYQERRFAALVLSRRPLQADPQEIAAALLKGIRQLGVDALPWDDAGRQVQARVESLRHWLPEQDWPALSDTELAADWDWLTPYLSGLSRREHLRRLNLADILQDRLSWPQRQQLEQLAPTRLAVPSGSRIALTYQPDGAPPVLAVKLQELFGLAATPTVAGGRVAVLLHLLSPARRPVQVTQDLAGFWRNTYPEVRKELQGRYPKHPWPDDPWTATPTAKAKSRAKHRE